jgi:hypothetical protein
MLTWAYNILPSGAHNICSVRVQRAWRGHRARKAVLGNGGFVFRDLMRIAQALSHHEWRQHNGPPLLFLELVFSQSFTLLACSQLMFVQVSPQHIGCSFA